MPEASGSASLGNAQGKITIDTSDLQRVQATTQQVGQTVARNLGQIDAGAKNAQKSIDGTASALGRMGGMLGIGTGVGLAITLGRLAIEADSIATAYNRQSVAAVNLAGSQAKLSDLLDAYDRATGGAVDKATALADVTHMQALGFADDADELSKFVTAARGISLAMGKSQDYVISQLNLAIANQSTMRLDQIGLSAAEVKKRIEDLQRANGGLTQEQAYQNAVLGIALEKYGKLVTSTAAQATGAEKAAKAWKDFKLVFGETTGPAVGGIMQGLTDELTGLSNLLKGVADDAHTAKAALDDMGKAHPTAGQAGGAIGGFLAFDPVKWAKDAAAQLYGTQGQIHTLENYRTSLLAERANASSPAEIAQLDDQLKQTNTQLAQLNGQLAQASTLANLPAVLPGFGKSPSYSTTQSAGGRTSEQIALMVNYQDSLAKIESEAYSQRISETEQYESQRTQVIQQYELTIAREAEDYGRQRARAERQLQKQLVDISAEQQSREAQYAIDLAESIAKITDDGNRRIADLEQDYQKQRERALQEHNDNLFKAAGELDAKAVAEENKRFATSSKNAEDDFQDRIAKEKEQINQRVQDEIEANDRRIQEGRKADLQRSLDLQQSYQEQQAQEAEDRALRLSRMAEDHDLQLAQLDQAHGQRLAQIDQHAAEERQQLEQEFLKQLAEKGLQNEQWKKLQDAKEKAAEDAFDKFWKHVTETFAPLGPPAPNAAAKGSNTFFPGFDTGGAVNKTGLAWLHAGEYVLNKGMVDYLGGASGPMAWGGGSKTINIADGAIQIHAGPGQSTGDIAMAVRAEIVAVFQELA